MNIVLTAFRRRFTLALGVVALLGAVDASAQILRQFPARALQGTLEFTAPPQVVLDGQQARLGPGVRIRDQHNRGVFANSLRGKSGPVKYVRDFSGMITEVWLMTPTEVEHDRRRHGGLQTKPAQDESLYRN